MPIKSAFENYLYAENREGSKKAGSYMTALKYLQVMLQKEPYGFADCIDLWGVLSVERLAELRERVKVEAKLGSDSPWYLPDAPSYLSNGYCSAALTQLIEFLPQHHFTSQALELLRDHKGEEAALAKILSHLDPEVLAVLVHDASSQDGKERVQSIKVRIGQQAFREMILKVYQNRCCLTGLDLPAVNRASHIIGWAERTETRMDPRNGLCLSATYDAAFDRKLITFDNDYRLVLSKTIREHVPSESLKQYFLSKEGWRLELPSRFQPLREYLEHHRKGGAF